MRPVPLRALLVAALVVVSWCVLAGSAQAFSLDSVEPVARAPSRGSPGAAPPAVTDPTAAAAHPDMSINLTFNGDGEDSVAGLRLDLAPGIVSFVNHVPVCETWDASTQTATDCPDS